MMEPIQTTRVLGADTARYGDKNSVLDKGISLTAKPGDTSLQIAERTLVDYIKKWDVNSATAENVVYAMRLFIIEQHMEVSNRIAVMDRFHERFLELGSIMASQAAKI